MSLATQMYDSYKKMRSEYPVIPARQAVLWARSDIVRKCRNQLLSKEDPRQPHNVQDALCDYTIHWRHNGYDCTLDVEEDDEMRHDPDYVVRKGAYSREHAGWGRDGMDIGEYYDGDMVIDFDDRRKDLITHAPKGASKQVAYEWATECMRNRLEHYKSVGSDDIRAYVAVIECVDLGIQASLWGVDIDCTDANIEEYVGDVVDELYSEFIYEFDNLKKEA